jgi:DNA-directed RNA polymerase subunit RPC12/RpoP
MDYDRFMCWYCGTPVTDEEPLGRSLRCTRCGRDLRVCRNCRFYLPGGGKDCKESQAEVPADKERANFCDWFRLDPKFRVPSAGTEGAPSSAAAKSAFDALFT